MELSVQEYCVATIRESAREAEHDAEVVAG
jgi:hypothetical protein